MDANESSLSFEQDPIQQDIAEDLVDHLYQDVPIASVAMLITSTAIAAFCYQHSNPFLAISWLLGLYTILIFISILYRCYKKYKSTLSLKTWGFLLSVGISCCAMLWGLLIVLNFPSQTHYMILLSVTLMVAAAFSLVNIGAFTLCLISLCFTLLPVTLWLALQSEEHYQYLTGFNVLYFLFLLGMNVRNNKWLLNSLKLSRIVTSSDYTSSQLALENELRYAIERKELEVYYQPIIDLHIGKVSGAEALMRWNHPTQGLILPIKFIPLTEKTEIIVPMGDWILEKAATQAVLWHQEGFQDFKIAINLAAKQLRQGNLVETVDKILAKTGIDPTCIELELTETAVLDEGLASIITALSNRGISLAIDDFGTGYSSFSYLKHFHIDKIKIDKTFIDDVTTNHDSATIVSAILTMAKELGIKTLAEGVETEAQLQFLKERGCQYIQGYYFSKPLKAEDFSAFMKADLKQKI